MDLLTEVNAMMNALGIPVETGVFSDEAPETYVVLTPLADVFDLHADNRPGVDIQEVRVSTFSKGNYLALKNQIVRAALDADMIITDRVYIGHEDETQYHHYAIDISKYYAWGDCTWRR
jgi:hypothetical protein